MLQLDVTSEASVTSCVSAVLERAGAIAVLVNNAAAGLIGAIEETSISEARMLFETNFFGTARMVNAVLPGMRGKKKRPDHQFRVAGSGPADPFPRLPFMVEGSSDHVLRRASPGSEEPRHRRHCRRTGHGGDPSGSGVHPAEGGRIAWWFLLVIVGTWIVMTALAAIPARIGGRRSVAGILQAEMA